MIATPPQPRVMLITEADMQNYRINRIDMGGHIAGPAIQISADGDREALRAAQDEARRGCDVELWQDDRLLAYVTGRHAAGISTLP